MKFTLTRASEERSREEIEIANIQELLALASKEGRIIIEDNKKAIATKDNYGGGSLIWEFQKDPPKTEYNLIVYDDYLE